MSRFSLPWIMLSLIAGPAVAQTDSLTPLAHPGQPGWQKSEPSGCFLWNHNPRPGEIVQWFGPCVDQRANGQGAVISTYDNKESKQEGNYRNGRLDGQGVTLSPDGMLYQGEFSNGLFDGQGLLTHASGARYKGEFHEGKFHGTGIYIYANGDRYDGQFREGKMSGRGQLAFKSGKRYYGDFENNKPHGNGRLDSTGHVWTGRWVEGCFIGMTGQAAVGTDSKICW